MKILVLDDDPTGTQSATGATVLLRWDAALILASLREADALYLQTNSRALDETAAVRLVTSIREDARHAAGALGEPVRIVLRGDSTLRGHVFAELEAVSDPDDVAVFLPAFPQGGRTTLDGLHRVRIDGRDLPAHESEYADDPVFGFDTGYLPDYAAQRSAREPVRVPLARVRAGELPRVLAEAPPGALVLPDAVTDDDVRLVAAAIRGSWEAGRETRVRGAAPLAAALAGVESTGPLPWPLLAGPAPTLLVCGSHTEGATRQLARVTERYGPPEEISTAAALEDPDAEAARVAARVGERLEDDGFAVVTSERQRLEEHDTLAHGERVMVALSSVVARVRRGARVVVAKGGITSAEIARTGLGADRALVLGQVLPGVSVWELETADGDPVLYVVVPGNVGEPDTIDRILELLAVPVTAG